MLADILFYSKTRTYIHPEQRVGQIDSTPGCHHTHQQRHRDHGASDDSPRTELTDLRWLHHCVCPLFTKQPAEVSHTWRDINTWILRENVKLKKWACVWEAVNGKKRQHGLFPVGLPRLLFNGETTTTTRSVVATKCSHGELLLLVYSKTHALMPKLPFRIFTINSFKLWN